MYAIRSYYDAFPNLLKPIILRSIERLSIETKVIANKKIHIGNSQHIEYIIVEQGADEADHRIVKMCEAKDLVVITSYSIHYTKLYETDVRTFRRFNRANPAVMGALITPFLFFIKTPHIK